MLLNRKYAYENDDVEFGERGKIIPVYEDTFDRAGWEQLFHNMPQEELEVLVCLYMGFKPVDGIAGPVCDFLRRVRWRGEFDG